MESSYMKRISLNEVNGKRVLAYEANPKKLNKNVKEALGTVMNTLGTRCQSGHEHSGNERRLRAG
ncbi:MAG: hypothetical protein ACLR8P_21200 [Clostridium fessum]